MGYRFRKSKSFGPFRVTASRSGLSYSIGGPGARYTVRADGKKQITTGIPGSGISYTKTVASSSEKRRSLKSNHEEVKSLEYLFDLPLEELVDELQRLKPFYSIESITHELEALEKKRQNDSSWFVVFIFVVLLASPILIILALIPGVNALLGVLISIPCFIGARTAGAIEDRRNLLLDRLEQAEIIQDLESECDERIADIIANQLDPSNPSNLKNNRVEVPCPYCAEIIKAMAIKCRFCNSDLQHTAF